MPAPGGGSGRRRRYSAIAKQVLPITQHFYTFFSKSLFGGYSQNIISPPFQLIQLPIGLSQIEIDLTFECSVIKKPNFCFTFGAWVNQTTMIQGKKKKPEKITYYVVLVASPAVHVIQDCLTAGVKLFIHVASLLPAHVQGV